MRYCSSFRRWAGIMVLGLLLLCGAAVTAFGLSWHQQIISALAPRLAIVTTADLQSDIYARPETDANGESLLVGGLDRVASLARRVAGEVDGSLLLSTGDDLMGAFYATFGGRPEIEALNLAGYDAVVVGNHEFDQGVAVYAAAAARAEFPILAANLEFTDSQLAGIVKPRMIREVGGVRVGLFGLVTPDLKWISAVGDGVVVDRDLQKVARAEVARLRAAGVELVILLSHCGSDYDRQTAAAVAGIDLIVGGHSHEYLCENVTGPAGDKCLIVQAGVGGTMAGVLRFTYRGGITDPAWELVRLDEKVGSVEAVKKYVDGYAAEFERRLGEPIGATATALEAQKAVLRTRESNLGDLVADAMADWFVGENGELPLALINGGAIRGDCLYPAGPLSRLDVLSMLPFGNTICRVELSGKELKAVLEASASALGANEGECPDTAGHVSSGGFLQMSRSLRVVYDPLAPAFCALYEGRKVTRIIEPGSRVVRVEIRHGDGWVPVDPDATYILYVNSWPAAGGDGHYLFPELEPYDTTVLVADALARYLERYSPVAPQVEGRIDIRPSD